jgi:hypothetical protein
VTAPAIILLAIGLIASHNLVVGLRAVVVTIVLMMIVGSLIIVIASVTLMVGAIFLTAILMVAQFTATCKRNLSRFLFLWLLVFGNFLGNAARSCLDRQTCSGVP